MTNLNEKIKANRISKKHITSKLVKRIRIFIVVIAIIICIGIYKVLIGEISVYLAILGLIIGIILGFVVGRMYKILWHEETQKVISQVDKIGLVFLFLYIAVEIGRTWFFGNWLQGAELSAFGLIFLAGLLFGRNLAMLKNIKKVLVEQNKI
jgi:hypothetical protein